MQDTVWRRYVSFPYVKEGTECGCCSVDPTGQWQRTEWANNYIAWEGPGRNGLKLMIHGPHSAPFLSLCKDLILQFITLRPPCFQKRPLWMPWTAGRSSLSIFHILPGQNFAQGMGLWYHLHQVLLMWTSAVILKHLARYIKKRELWWHSTRAKKLNALKLYFPK